MPRHVDHEARRRQIADAVCELIAERGIEAVTLREVAARAGVSMGAVQRSFPKDGMVLFALEHILAVGDERAKARVAALDKPESALALLRITLRAIAIVGDEDDAAAVNARVWLAFAAQAAVRPDLGEVVREHYGKGRDLLAWLVAYGKKTGEFRADLDAVYEARALFAVADGLTVEWALRLVTLEDAHRIVDDAIERLRA